MSWAKARRTAGLRATGSRGSKTRWWISVLTVSLSRISSAPSALFDPAFSDLVICEGVSPR